MYGVSTTATGHPVCVLTIIIIHHSNSIDGIGVAPIFNKHFLTRNTKTDTRENHTPENKNPVSKLETGFSVELQGFEPWSRQGSRRAFYVRIYA